MAQRRSPTTLAFVPFLMLPMLIAAFALIVHPALIRSVGFVLLLTVGFAWYFLGGSLAILHVWRQFLQRREVRALRPAMYGSTRASFVTGPDGLVLAQNCALTEAFGDMVGRSVHDLLSHKSADPDHVWRVVQRTLIRKGRASVDIGHWGAFEISRQPGAQIQLWRAADVEEVLPVVSFTPEASPADFDELPVALMMLDERALICRANSAAEELFGASLQGANLASLVEGPGRSLMEWIGDASSGRLNGSSEVLRVRGEGAERFVQLRLRHSQSDKVIAVISDASDLKRLEAQFVQSQKMQAIGQLAGGIAHDFNNLLTAISGHCDLLMLRHDKGDPDYADLDQISQNANRAAALVGQLLAYSRKQTLKFQLFDVRDSLADLTHLLNRLVGEKVVLTFDHDPRLHPIRADRRQLEQVIMNLVVNARDAMAEGGDIAIRTANLHIDGQSSGEHQMLPTGDYVRVDVEDSGCGIPDDIATKIFEPFFSTKRTGEGTGLGLSTAYGIVKQSGGYIFCESEVNVGTVFSLYFPAHIGAPPEDEPDATIGIARKPVAAPQQIDREATVLLVEDEAPVRAFASRALQLQGFKVLEAASAEDALELLSDQRITVDVFVTDVVMPGMDGPAWVRTALRDRPSTKVIFMSGYTEGILGEGALPVPNAAFLAKPFSLSELTSLVSKQVEESGAPKG